MRIAFHTYSTAFRNPGGGEVQLLKTKEFLEKLGVQVKIFDPASDRLADFDLLHVFSSVPECLSLIQQARAAGLPVVTSTVLWSDWRMALGAPTLREKIQRLSHHATKWVCPVFPSGRRRVLTSSDILLPNSEMEKTQIVRYFAIQPSKILVIPNAVDSSFTDASPELARRQWGNEPFILCVGRIEPRKNQLNLIRALKRGVRRRLIVLGDTVKGYESYEKTCREEGAGFAEFYPALAHSDPLLRSAYAAASVFVAPGWFETPSLAALEAALVGARVVVTSGGSTREYFGDRVHYLNPLNLAQIASAVEDALDHPVDPLLRQWVREKYTWEACAHATHKAYQKAVALAKPGLSR